MNYKEYILESLSVSDNVIELTNKIYDIICRKTQEGKTFISKTDNKIFKCDNFDVDTQSHFSKIKTLLINYIAYCVDRREEENILTLHALVILTPHLLN